MSVAVRVQSESEWFFYLDGVRKSTLYVVKFRGSNSLYSVSSKLLFNLVKVLINWNDGLGRSVFVRVQSKSQKIFDIGGILKKYFIRCQISCSKTRYKVFQYKLLSNLVKDIF